MTNVHKVTAALVAIVVIIAFGLGSYLLAAAIIAALLFGIYGYYSLIIDELNPLLVWGGGVSGGILFSWAVPASAAATSFIGNAFMYFVTFGAGTLMGLLILSVVALVYGWAASKDAEEKG